jgi:hypothetical protein
VQPAVFVGVAIVALLVLLRHAAARRVSARDSRFVPFMFAPTILGATMILWAAMQVISTSPPIGLLLGLAGIAYVGLLARTARRMQRSVDSTPPGGDVSAAITEPLADSLETVIGAVLVAGLVAVVGLIVWAVILAAR